MRFAQTLAHLYEEPFVLPFDRRALSIRYLLFFSKVTSRASFNGIQTKPALGSLNGLSRGLRLFRVLLQLGFV